MIECIRCGKPIRVVLHVTKGLTNHGVRSTYLRCTEGHLHVIAYALWLEIVALELSQSLLDSSTAHVEDA
jgi:hypothetical protein